MGIRETKKPRGRGNKGIGEWEQGNERGGTGRKFNKGNYNKT